MTIGNYQFSDEKASHRFSFKDGTVVNQACKSLYRVSWDYINSSFEGKIVLLQNLLLHVDRNNKNVIKNI